MENTTKHFDLEELRDKLDNDEPFIREFLAMLSDELTTCLTNLKNQVNNKNMEGIRNASHRIKGSALNACFPNLGKLGASLEKLPNPTPEKIADLASQIENEIALVKITIKDYLK